ncbi:MAG: septal ring lytic transglycosylase RlpA family protein [Ignavibacterium sp.]|nr:MAG: septal ring lytic transglycosylase RlpA family protein [Ignavibacterium sp.]
MIMVFAVVGLGGFTIVNSVKGTSDIPLLTEEFVPVTEDIIENTTAIRYINHGTMRASWYGPRFHGKTTANGEIYDQTALTAAHKSLGFGTILKVTNPRNNKSVIVRINDRGPYIPGRQLDLSKAAAEQLDVIFSGVKRLKVEEVVITGIDNPIVSQN